MRYRHVLVASRQTSTAATPPSMDRFAKGLLPFCGATGVLFVDHRYTRATRWSHIRDQLAL